MAKTKICKTCGKEYSPCKTRVEGEGIFRWQDVACCPACGKEYFRKVIAARGMNMALLDGEEPESTPKLTPTVTEETVEEIVEDTAEEVTEEIEEPAAIEDSEDIKDEEVIDEEAEEAEVTTGIFGFMKK